jgi:pulcherriminic acid synthase
VKFSWLETLRHSTPVLTANRWTRHEVERFGQLLPEGALVICAAGAANRDPRLFAEPDRFDVARKDLCPREPRGQYRADGLPAGIAFGLGKPTKFPAVPEDRPRSLYAITRDTAVAASNILLDRLAHLRLKSGPAPMVRSLRVGDMHACWSLPVTFRA